MSQSSENSQWLDGLDGARRADPELQELAAEFERNRDRLKRMVHLRLDPRLRGRFDPSDVVQEAFLDTARRLPEYARDRSVPLFVWLRQLTSQRLIDLHRMHLGAQARDASLEVSLQWGNVPHASSISIANDLLGRVQTPSAAAIAAEVRVRVQEALVELEPLDREVLVLRHFEMLTNEETAQVLSIKKTAASNRYVRALRRLAAALQAFPEFRSNSH